MRLTTLLLIVPLTAAVVGGCGKSKPAENAAIEDATGRLTSAGLKVEGLTAADPGRYAAQRCQAGRVENFDALLCEYGDVAALEAARKKMEGWIANAVTGVTLKHGRVLVGVADRGRVDPNGKNLRRIIQALNGK
ncbi:MAG TPA: hypothetical protein VH877_20825 [Polyangia bacterium]|jgi:hypothetical protein|nr:hypothetical protein [Polyangia bacterium]